MTKVFQRFRTNLLDDIAAMVDERAVVVLVMTTIGIAVASIA